jgi:hypothetical protein
MKTYSHEDVVTIFNNVLRDAEKDLVHHIKHSREIGEKSVAQLRVLDIISRGINSRLTEELGTWTTNPNQF